MRHLTVYKEQDQYIGWPANHGHYQWGNEFLVGMMKGTYGKTGMHNIWPPFTKFFCRSLDGGETWAPEYPNVDFVCAAPEHKQFYGGQEGTIYRVCGVYDTGGADCYPTGGYYLSTNKGKYWYGPFLFNGFHDTFESIPLNTSRTAVLGRWFFLTLGSKKHWGRDYVVMCDFDGKNFHQVSVVLKDNHRAVMPAVAKVDNRIYVTMRRRGGFELYENWIDIVYSDDEGKTWSEPQFVGETGQDNGNPPALINWEGNLICTYANRTKCAIMVACSSDGKHWDEYVLRQGQESDIGYPRLFKRKDGNLVCVYYWADKKFVYDDPNPDQQHIEATIFHPKDLW